MKLAFNKLNNVKGLENPTQLMMLALSSNQLRDVKSLKRLTQLMVLRFLDNPDLTKIHIAQLL